MNDSWISVAYMVIPLAVVLVAQKNARKLGEPLLLFPLEPVAYLIWAVVLGFTVFNFVMIAQGKGNPFFVLGTGALTIGYAYYVFRLRPGFREKGLLTHFGEVYFWKDIRCYRRLEKKIALRLERGGVHTGNFLASGKDAAALDGICALLDAHGVPEAED